MKETEIDNREKQQLELDIKRKLLDSYFQFRSPLPTEGYIQENKTTLEIQDELEAMMHVGGLDVVEYMDNHDYGFITERDGTVRWAIWRQP